MAIFTKQNFVERCHDVLANTNVLTREDLVEKPGKPVRSAVGLQTMDPIDAEKYSRMEGHLLDIIRIVEAHSDEKLDVRAVINNRLLIKELIEAQMVD